MRKRGLLTLITALASPLILVLANTAAASPTTSSGSVKPYSSEDLRCLSLNIYHEARGEDLDGMVAVTQVVLNRVENAEYPNTICGVVQEDRSGGQGKCQFSWWCDGKSDEPEEAEAWERAQAVARSLLEEPSVPQLVPDVMHYVRCGVRATWLNSMSFYRQIGDHCFYRDDQGDWEVQVAENIELDSHPEIEFEIVAEEQEGEEGVLLAYSESEGEIPLPAPEEMAIRNLFAELMKSNEDYEELRIADVHPASSQELPRWPVATFLVNTLLARFDFSIAALAMPADAQAAKELIRADYGLPEDRWMQLPD